MNRRGKPTEAVRVPPVLGVDVGGVLVDRVAEDSDTSFFGSRPMDTPAVPGAFEAVADLCATTFAGRVCVVSKAGPKIAALTARWLEERGFFETTGVSRDDLIFVRKRVDKAEVCRARGVTHFVDDRVDVLEHLRSVVAYRFLFTGGLGANPEPMVPPGVRRAGTWPEMAAAICGRVPRTR